MVYEGSRYTFCEKWTSDDGTTFLDERKPFRYQVFDDNRVHRVVQGETLFTLAGNFFASRQRPAGLWWVIADFQPQPIHDPTIALIPGSLVVIPSERTVVEVILNERRRDESRV